MKPHEKLRHLRIAARLGVRELARRANLSATFISRLESGHEKSLSPSALLRVCKTLKWEEVDAFKAFGVVHPDIIEAFKKAPGTMIVVAREVLKNNT